MPFQDWFEPIHSLRPDWDMNSYTSPDSTAAEGCFHASEIPRQPGQLGSIHWGGHQEELLVPHPTTMPAVQQQDRSQVRELLLQSFLVRLAVFGLAGLAVTLFPIYDASSELLWESECPGLASRSSGLPLDPEVLVQRFLSPFLHWDGLHFLEIARQGYLHEKQFAFFPLLPAGMRSLSRVLETAGPCSSLSLSLRPTTKPLDVQDIIHPDLCYCFPSFSLPTLRFSGDLQSDMAVNRWCPDHQPLQHPGLPRDVPVRFPFLSEFPLPTMGCAGSWALTIPSFVSF